MRETNAHLLLKQQAKKILVTEYNFKPSEIKKEYYKKSGKFGPRVDIVGISKQNKIAIECGAMHCPSKIEKLKESFDKIIWLPYLKLFIYKRPKTVQKHLRALKYLKQQKKNWTN